jgi:hypothetical protein
MDKKTWIDPKLVEVGKVADATGSLVVADE